MKNHQDPSPLSPSGPDDANAPDTGGDTGDQEKLAFKEISLESAGQPRRSPEAIRRLNDWVGRILVALILIAPVPVGSNRPVFWMIWAALIGLLGAVYFALLAWMHPARRSRVPGIRAILILGLAVPMAGLVQLVPFGAPAIARLSGELQPSGITLSSGATLLGVVRVLSYALLFALATEIATYSGRVRTLAWGIFFGVIIHALWGLSAMTLLGDIAYLGDKDAYQGMATGTFINRNSFATFLGMGLVLGLALIMNRSRRPHERVPRGKTLLSEKNLETAALWLGLFIVAAALLATQSRMGITASLSGALVVYFVMSWKINGHPGAALLRVTLIVVISVIALFYLFGQGAIERSIFVVSNADTRLDLYAQVLGMIFERPWSGHGLDTFRAAYELYHQPPVSVALSWNLTHNTYLALWVEMGVIIGSLPILAVLLAAIKLIQIIRRRRSSFAVSVAALGAIVVAAIHSLTDFSLEIEANTLMFILLVALGLGQFRRKEDTW